MLYLDLNGIEMQLRINQFREDFPGESEYENWCLMDFAVLRNGVDIYHKHKNKPLLTCDEVKELRDTIASIADGSLTQNKRLSFIEPDIELEVVFHDGEFSYADMILSYWETEGCGCLTGNRLVLCLDMCELERVLCYLQFKTNADYDVDLFEKYCMGGVIKLDKLTFKRIDGEIAVGVTPKYRGVVGIYINGRELLDLVNELEKGKWKSGARDYIHQTAAELYGNLVPNDDLKDWQKENGTEILSCTCGIIEDSSPTVFIDTDERFVYWKALGHNQMDKEQYYFPLNYVFDRKEYAQALEELKKFVADESIY